MPAIIKIKNSSTLASVPSGLTAGEMAVNLADKKLYIGGTSGTNVTFLDSTSSVGSFNGLTGAVQGVSAAVAGTGISVSGATGSVTITYDLYAQTNKATPVAADLVQINNGSINNQPRNATIGAVLDIIAGDVAVSNTGASTYSAIVPPAKGGLGLDNSAAVNGQILVAKSTDLGDPILPIQFIKATLGTGTGISTTTGEGTLQINNTGVLSFNSLTGAVTGITAGGANTFTQLNTFSAGISASAVTADAYKLSSSGIQAKTASYSLVAGDNGKIITMNVATANNLTVPASLDVGFNCTIIQLGAGQTTIVASGTTLNSYQGYLKISGQHGSASIVSYTSNVYNVAGSLSA